MNDDHAIERLRDYLDKQPAGTALDSDHVANLLSACWNDLVGGNATKMRAEKLWRIERPTWHPPFLDFFIERHGQTVNGSTRVTIYRWRVDVAKGTAESIDEKRRQLYATDERLYVTAIAESLVDSIIHGLQDARVIVGKDRTVKLKIDMIIPATNRQTTAARRSRLRKQLAAILAPHGWKELRANVFQRK
jgi:hypothetical protein